MQILKRDSLGMVIKKALRKDGVFVDVEIKEEKIKEEIYLKGKSFGRGSYLFSFKFSLPLYESSKLLTIENLVESFRDISATRKEFGNNLIVNKEKNYCQIWIDSDEDSVRNVIEIILNLKYDLKDWKIINISK